MKLRKVVFVSCLLIALTLFVNGVILLINPNFSTSSRQQPGKQSPTPITISDEEEPLVSPLPEVVETTPINILLMGLDQEEIRSDVIILLNYHPDSGKMNLLSVPRDTRVKVRGRFEKINALYALGKENLLISGIEQLTGLPVDYYLTLNFKGFRKIIDTVDGVEINVPFNMDYDDPDQNLHIHLKKGTQVLYGEKAEGFVRYRKGNRKNEGYEDGDIGRIKMQQEFVRELFVQKMKLKYLSKADDIFFILKKYMKTNVEIRDIRKYVGGIKNISYEKIHMFTVPGDSKYMNDLWYFIADKKETRKMIDGNFH